MIAPSGTGVGPRTAGLPPGFPDPNDYLVGDESYVVGIGAKNLFPVFTVGGGLDLQDVDVQRWRDRL